MATEAAEAIGRPLDRADGRLKVTGGARYAAEFALPGLVHAVVAQSAIANGRVRQIDIREAAVAPGVLTVLTAADMPRLTPAPVTLANRGSGAQSGGSAGQEYLPLQDDRVHYAGQHLTVVVAETFEQATYAASLVRVEYAEETPRVELDAEMPNTFTPDNGWPDPAETSRGDTDRGLAEAAVRVDAVYHTALQHHVAMEPHATTASWDGDTLMLHEPSTFVYGTRKTVAIWLGIPEESVRVVAPFVGGSFGCKGPTWPHVALAAVAARRVGRPVRLTLTRPQTFTSNGYRPRIRHHIALGALPDGTLTAIRHDAVACTAVFDHRIVAPVTKTTPKVYACPNVRTTYRMVHLNLTGPFTFRGPGETPGLFALESAIDELAEALRIDPIALRRMNYADTDPEDGKPWSSKSLRRCYQAGAERFGWERRNSTPRSVRDGEWWVGMGMAGMMYDAKSAPTSASARMEPDGRVIVASATCDQGTGSYTVFPQIAADALGVPVEAVRFELGDTALPQAPISAGSQTVASVGSAVRAAARALRSKLLALAFADPASPLQGLAEDSVVTTAGRIASRHDPARSEAYVDVMRRAAPGAAVSATEKVNPSAIDPQVARCSFGAHFAEVRVHAETGEPRITRYVGAFGAGRIVNPKTARSQLLGGIVWGIGMALTEETHLHPRHGRIANADLAEYHVPVNADIPEMDVLFVAEQDTTVNPIGAKGIGEIGTIGAAAAVANAVYNATGIRVRDLPITPDKLMYFPAPTGRGH